MNIEITDLDMILDYLETTSLEPHDDYSSEFTYKEQKILYKYIKQLQKENKQLKERIEYLERSNNRREDTILEQRQEISDLEDNWNKLKDYIVKEYYMYLPLEASAKSITILIDKMQELEKGSDNK